MKAYEVLTESFKETPIKTAEQTDQQADQQTDRWTDIVTYRDAIAAKIWILLEFLELKEYFIRAVRSDCVVLYELL